MAQGVTHHGSRSAVEVPSVPRVPSLIVQQTILGSYMVSNFIMIV